jgi:transposase
MLNASPEMTDLPDDIAILKAMVSARDLALVERDGVVQQQLESIAQMQRTLQARALEIERLKLQIAKLKRMQFGSSSEKLDREIERLEMRLEELEATDGEAQVTAELEQKKVKPRKPSTRRALPAHLPREDHIYEPAEVVCPECAGELKPLGEDVAEQLTIIKAAFKVIRHIRRKKACVRCDCIVQAPAPSRPIERGIASAALLAHVIVSKFCDHLPLYRQCDIWARQGIHYDRSVMARQIGLCCALMRPLDDALYRMWWRRARCMRTTRRSRYCRRATKRPKRGVCGSMCAMIAVQVRRHPPRSGLHTRQIDRGNILKPIWPTLPVCCKRMRSRATTPCTRAGRSMKQLVWPTLEEKFTICM